MIATLSVVAFTLVIVAIILMPVPPIELIYGTPPDRDSPDREREILTRAAWHREQIEALHAEFCEIRDYPQDSFEWDEFSLVIYDGYPASDAEKRIASFDAGELWWFKQGGEI